MDREPDVYKPAWFNLYRIFDRYLLHDDHLTHNTGILLRTDNNVLYKQIVDVNVTRNILQQMLGTANVVIHTQRNRSNETITFYDLVEYKEVSKYLLNESSKKGFLDAM